MAGQPFRRRVPSPYEDVVLMGEEEDRAERNETVDDQERGKEP